MARPIKQFTADMVAIGTQLRLDGATWQELAVLLGISKYTAMYHIMPGRKEKQQETIKKYQLLNYESVRKNQREYTRRRTREKRNNSA